MKISRLLSTLTIALSLAFSGFALAADEAPATDTASVSDASPAPQNVVVAGTPATSDSAPASEKSSNDKTSSDQSWYSKAWDTAGQHLSDIWNKGDIEVYVPFWSYHLPFAYSAEKRSQYTEYPAGGGIGKGWYNASGNWEGIYLMEFQDSHGKPMYMGGYGWVPTWNPINEKSRIGVGATVFMFMRSDINYYAPTPGILPMGTIGYGPVDVQVAYIPGGQGYGNVLFWWAKYSFK